MNDEDASSHGNNSFVEQPSCLLLSLDISAVHRSRRAGAGVLTYFDGAGAGVCSHLAKTPEALICAANYHFTSAKEFMIDNYGILYYFVYHCGVCNTVGRVKHPIKF